MKHLFSLIIICLFVITAGIAQIPSDTIYFKSGKKIIGSIIEQIPNKTVKIKTKNLGIRIYNLSEIKRIGSKPKEDLFKELVYLKSGEVVKGAIIEKLYNKSIKIKTVRLGEMTYQDSEIDSICEIIKPEEIERSINFKDGEIINGYVVEEVPGKSIKIKTKSQGILTFNLADIEKILESKKNEKILESDIYLLNGMMVHGLINERTENSIIVRTKKYGNFKYNLNEIQKIEDVKEVEPIMVVEEKNSLPTESSKNTFLAKSREFFSESRKNFKIYDTNAIFLAEILLSENTYFLTQVGFGITLFKQAKFAVAPELRIGIATNPHFINNNVLSISPLLLKYNHSTKIKLELGPDFYIRMYDGGSTTRVGIITGANYAVTPKIFVGIRSSLYNHLFGGLLGSYSF